MSPPDGSDSNAAARATGRSSAEGPAHPGTAASGHFADHLIARVRELGHPLCVGIDPHLELIPPLFRRGSMAPADPQTAEAVDELIRTALDRIAGRAAIVKPQIAFFEQLGWRGMRVLADFCERARARELLVLLDAKRGDIGSTAQGYAQAYLRTDAAMPVDALTLSPYLGFDTLEPFADAARGAGRGLFVLVRTSNTGSGDLQDRDVGGEPLFGRVAAGLRPLADDLVGPSTGWSSLGVVCGATAPEQARRVRDALPRALFLVPGYGAQGGCAEAAVQGFVPGPAGLEGGVVSSSRAILSPSAARTASRAGAWEAAVDEALARAIGELGEAVGGG